MVQIEKVTPRSPAAKAGIHAGDRLLHINDVAIRDVLDYQFYATDANCKVTVEREQQVLTFSLKNREYEDLGLEFATYLMDEKKRCTNNCIFCFIDQNPPGMRETIYFKDDDERLSFLQGNYITLTNLRDEEIERIIRMRISPVNVSVHTMNPDLRVKMMRNRFAGEKLRYLKDLDSGGIQINAQLVLCKGINDGEELRYSLQELCKLENLQSVAVVPCGMTEHRDGLCEIEPFDASAAKQVIDCVTEYGDVCLSEKGFRTVFASDEFYLTAGIGIPEAEYYEDYPQLENGVGMLRLLTDEFRNCMDDCPANITSKRHVSIATGALAAPQIRYLAGLACEKYPLLTVDVYAIRNDFFGPSITVSGLVTGGDLIRQLREKELGDVLLIPENMVRYEGDLFLDNVSVTDVKEQLGIPVMITGRGGDDLYLKIVGEELTDE